MKYPGLTLGLIEAIVNKLGGIDGVRSFLRGETEVVTRIHNEGYDTFLSVDGPAYRIVRHVEAGHFCWKSCAVKLCSTKELINSLDKPSIQGFDLFEKIKDQPVLGLSTLNYLLDNTTLIPEEWKKSDVFFWGTVLGLCDEDGEDFYVYCLHWSNESKKWEKLGYCLSNYWHDNQLAVMLTDKN